MATPPSPSCSQQPVRAWHHLLSPAGTAVGGTVRHIQLGNALAGSPGALHGQGGQGGGGRGAAYLGTTTRSSCCRTQPEWGSCEGQHPAPPAPRQRSWGKRGTEAHSRRSCTHLPQEHPSFPQLLSSPRPPAAHSAIEWLETHTSQFPKGPEHLSLAMGQGRKGTPWGHRKKKEFTRFKKRELRSR